MIVQDAIEEIVSEGEFESVVEKEEEPMAHPEEGELLVICRNLTMKAKKEEEHRDNIFHTHCNIHGKVCDLIIDNESCTNVAYTTLVSKLNLATTKHPHPYHL